MSKALDIIIKIVLIRNSFGKGIVCHAPAETREDFETTYPDVKPAKAIPILAIPIHKRGLDVLFRICSLSMIKLKSYQ
jgi:hypothetical protein